MEPMKTITKPRKLYEEQEKICELLPISDLAQWIKDYPVPSDFVFKPIVHWNRDGNFLEAYWKDDSCYAEPVGELTLMRSHETDEVVGIQIHRVTKQIGLVEVPTPDKAG